MARARSKIDLKVVLLGAHATGKTCLVNRYLHDQFSDQQATVGAAFGSKSVTVKDQSFMIGIWDTAGAERYESMAKMYYRGAGAAIICFDLTARDSYKRVEFWINELKANEPECRIFIVGNKLDLITSGEKSRGVEHSESESLATTFGATYFETSAKTSKGVDEAFQRIADDCVSVKPAADVRETATTAYQSPQGPDKVTLQPAPAVQRPKKDCAC
eukprot:TRINITY_DN14200_c0_g1_i1.p1 TRINITY_DN14200_c0_g1~~TRINITY_DN14200_c0_g1_i1.p1  ORF type:complete len:233 (-),score=19.83 TRINITY_DN14200_c0_g1_i1:43-690(-)